MTFRTELTEAEKRPLVQFLDDAKVNEHKRKTAFALWVGGIAGLIVFFFLLTLDWVVAIIGFIVITFLVAGALLPDEGSPHVR
jgi:hypothetical protein